MKMSVSLAEMQRSAPLTFVLTNYTQSHLHGDSIFKLKWKKLDSCPPGPEIIREDMSGKAEEHIFWICVRICKQWEPLKEREKLTMVSA